MKILHLVFHPDLKKSKVNAAWYDEAVKAGFTVKDMYALYPDFQIDVEKEQADLLAHDRIVLQFPFYWYNCPPLMKKWLDDVLSFGFAYGPVDKLQLKGKELVLCLSAGGPQDAYMPGGYNNFGITEFLRPFQQTAFLCRMTYCAPFWMHGAVVASPELAHEFGRKMVAHISDPSIGDVWSVQNRIFKTMGVA